MYLHFSSNQRELTGLCLLSLVERFDVQCLFSPQVPGGNMRDSFLVNGVAFKKTFSYAGFEQQPKKFVKPKILLLNIELELKSEKENAEIRYGVVLSMEYG